MNRPKFKDYPNSDYTYEEKQDKYLNDLEKYCDYLEQENFEMSLYGEENVSLKLAVNTLEQRCSVLKKALDKALYKWITHEQPKLIRGTRGGFIASVRKTIDVNKEEIFKEVQDDRRTN